MTPASYTTIYSIKQDQQAIPKFTKDALCYYTVQFPQTAIKGDVMYINPIILQNVKSYVYISSAIDTSYVVSC